MKKIALKIFSSLFIIVFFCVRSTINPGLIECSADGQINDFELFEERYVGEYNISYILSHYSYFVKRNLIGNSSAHTVGCVMVGGTLKLENSLGLVKSADSYANTIVALSDYPVETWNFSEDLEDIEFYYTTSMLPGAMNWLLERMQQTSSVYFDAETAFSCISNESSVLASKGKGRDSGAYDVQNGVLTIDFSVSRYVTLTFSDFSAADSIELKNVTGKDFLNNDYIISVEGEGDITLDMADITICGVPLNSCYFMSLVNGMELSYNGGQFYSGGLNLVWNFPCAANVTVNSLSGHLVAPKGAVNILSGNHEGQVIAQSVYTASEAHFYPCNVEIGRDYKTEPSTGEPDTEEPSTEEPDTGEPRTEESDTEEPSTEKSDTEETDTEELDTGEPNTKDVSFEEFAIAVPEVKITDSNAPETSDRAIPAAATVIMSICGAFCILGVFIKRKINR